MFFPRVLVPAFVAAVASAQAILPPPPVPAGNPQTPDKVLLGKALFWDEQLSSTHGVACGTCHSFAHGGADARAATSLHPGADGVFGTDDDVHGSPGVPRHDRAGTFVGSDAFGAQAQVTRRRAPSPINAAYARALFVDGRADDVFVDPQTGAVVLASGAALENQIARPPVDTTEMAHLGRTWADIAAELPTLAPLRLAINVPAPMQQFVAGRTYADLFQQVYGTPGVTPVRIVFAIAAYERTLISDQSPFDRYLAGQHVLAPLEQAGQLMFQSFCAGCHTDLDAAVLATGPVLDDYRNIGVRAVAADPGRSAVTADPLDRGRFRVPGLRNVALRAPYFHDGSASSIQQVVEFYARGGDEHDNQDPLVAAIGGHIAIADFLTLDLLLQTLTDPRVQNELPPFDRPTLWSEGPFATASLGGGLGAVGAPVPRGTALGVAVTDNARFAVGVDGLRPGAPALLLVDRALAPVPLRLGGHEFRLAFTPDLLTATATAGAIAGSEHGACAGFRVPVPAVAALLGPWFGQWAALDATARAGFATSDAFRFVLF